MERPLSAASSGTTQSTSHTTTTHQHRRHPSSAKNGVRSTGNSTVSLFLTNLRLLDLDLNPEWPNITVSSFSNQDARTRIKCTEYALYQLFRLYDPATTADKLQPFFPPLEPLQSVNLRAALFRCLSELKKSGVLAKDTVLRKTMLDECSGDKFWEVCLGFSAVVLRRRTGEKRKSSRSRRIGGHAVAEKLGTAQGVSKGQRESMLPLAVAHKAALGRVLETKKEKKLVYGRLYNLLASKEDELAQRKVRSEDLIRSSKAVKPERLKAVEDTVQRHWIGSADLRDALIEGDTCPKGDGLLVKSFDHLWNSDGRILQRDSGGAEVGLLQSLNGKATEQTARLRRWQHFHDRLAASKPQSARSSRPASQVQKTGITFNKHRDINLNDSSDDDDGPQTQQKPRPRHDSVQRYDDILTAMREELRKNTTSHRIRPSASPIQQQQSFHPPKRAQTQPVAPMRKLSVAIDTSAGIQSSHARSPSGTTVPLRSPMGRRVSSRSRSYDKPKVDGQRQPIPLKAELFSPLKESNRRSSLSPLSANSMLAPPAEDEEEDEDEQSAGAGDKDGSQHEIDNVDGGVESPASPRDSGLDLKADMAVRNVAFRTSSSESVGSTSSSNDESRVPAQPLQQSNGRMSLAERTRKSMAPMNIEKIDDSPSEPSSTLPEPSDTSSPALDTTTSETLNQDSLDRRTSLLNRTLHSLSLAPPPTHPSQSGKPSHHRSRTSIYPINQFETPKKVRRSTIGDREGKNRGKRDVTPMETLMSPQAEYESVFKSRPKIATSPVLSPCREGGFEFGDEVGAEGGGC
ncbi:uncharacterized protein LTR77_007773 [Saxophila tyrrhenica]|uniref:HAUS augmin-like complex subunit 6 N-terminal domain-containing protein n=1 Tax=Saxophila tyrrhenica TaxID=1690608 RepID=A0AAV9P327_9PEZI|nr:hypothetical protein LTR77_007773 [Saxophila tyrrhenica]